MLNIKRLLLGLILLLAPAAVKSTTVQLTGTLATNVGGVNGQGCFKLPVNVIDTSTNRALSPQTQCFRLTNGTFPVFAQLVPNDVMQPQATYYQFIAYDSTGLQLFMANYVIPTGAGTFNIGTAVPTVITTSNISYVNPANLNTTNTWIALQTFLGGIAGTTATFTGLGTFGSLQINGNAVINGTISIGGGTPLLTSNTTGSGPIVLQTAPTIITAIINGATTGTGIQGTDTKLMTSGTVSGAVGSQFCLDANNGATTVNCIINVTKIQAFTFCPAGCTITGTPCTTAGTANAQCTNAITWPVAFVDANYAAACNGVGTGSGFPFVPLVTKSASVVTVVTSNGQGSAAVTSNFSEIDCTGTHP